MTGNEFFRTITEEILDYVIREMTYVGADANGVAGFYSTQDTDPTPLRSGDDRSEGEEGKFFVWTPAEIRGILGNQASPLPSGGGREGGRRCGRIYGRLWCDPPRQRFDRFSTRL